jgi:hypothetical protein
MASCTRSKDSCEVRSGPIAIHAAILRIAASANQQIGRSRTKPDARTSQENGMEKQISSLLRRDETPSSTTGRNEIIDNRFWVSHDYQRLSSKIGRAGRVLALLGLPLSSNAEEWLRLRFLLRGGKRIARWR